MSSSIATGGARWEPEIYRQFAAVKCFSNRVGSLLPDGGTKPFYVVNTRLAKIVFAGKNRLYVFIKIKLINFCLYLIE